MRPARDRLWDRVARQQDDALERRDDVASARAGFLECARRPRRTRTPWLLAIGATAAIAVIALVPRTPESLSIVDEVGAPRTQIDLDATTAPVTPLRFSDGSVVSLRAGARARVQRLSATGAHLIVERGGIDAAVTHADRTRWTFDVGPYRVHVTGTRFTSSWDPSARAFALAMQEGSVVVTGPLLEPDGRRLQAGEGLRVGVEDEPATPQPPAVMPAPTATPPPLHPRAASPRLPDFARLSLQGRYAEAVTAAESIAAAELCAAAAPGHLLSLGDAARFAGRPDVGARAYACVRARASDPAIVADATFALGRLSFDRGHFDDAAAWFARYAAEQPAGPLLREALGRRLEALVRAGADAHEAATHYLDRFADGPHAVLARSQLAPR